MIHIVVFEQAKVCKDGTYSLLWSFHFNVQARQHRFETSDEEACRVALRQQGRRLRNLWTRAGHRAKTDDYPSRACHRLHRSTGIRRAVRRDTLLQMPAA